MILLDEKSTQRRSLRAKFGKLFYVEHSGKPSGACCAQPHNARYQI